jgi:hypothetical protein
MGLAIVIPVTRSGPRARAAQFPAALSRIRYWLGRIQNPRAGTGLNPIFRWEKSGQNVLLEVQKNHRRFEMFMNIN